MTEQNKLITQLLTNIEVVNTKVAKVVELSDRIRVLLNDTPQLKSRTDSTYLG